MGNKILTAYKVEKTPSVQSLELRWTLFPATHNDRPEEPLTVFLFEKKHIDRYPKANKDAILETLRRDAQSLQRLRHPNVLHVMEALVEEKTTLAFAIKPVQTNLAQILDRSPMELSRLEMKCGLLDISEAVRFLHHDAKTAHLGIAPVNIFITAHGKWLLGGFGYSQGNVEKGIAQDCRFTFTVAEMSHIGSDPSLKYCAPEITSGFPGKFGLESDIFSLGLVVYEVMSKNRRPLLGTIERYDRTAHQKKLRELLPFRESEGVPQELRNIIPSMLAPSPEHRCEISAFLASEFFQDIHIKALRFLETLAEKDDAQKAQFLKGFTTLLEQPESALTSERMLKERVLPQLIRAINYPPLYSHVLANVLICLQKAPPTPADFQKKCWNGMKVLFSAKEIPIEAVLSLVKNIDLLMSLIDQKEAQAVLLPFLLRCLELPEPRIQQEALEKVPLLHGKFGYREVKDQMLPRMIGVLLKPDSSLKARVLILNAINSMFSTFDRSTITDTILVACERVQKMDSSPALCMVLLSCYDAMSKQLGHKETAQKILPLCIPILAEESLTSEQWHTQLSVCKKLLQRIESARGKEYATRNEYSADVSAALGQGVSAPTSGATANGTASKVPDADVNFLMELGGGASTGEGSGMSTKTTTNNDLFAGMGGTSKIAVPPPVVNNLVKPPMAGADDPFSLLGGTSTTNAPKSTMASSFPTSFPAPSTGSTNAGNDLLGLGGMGGISNAATKKNDGLLDMFSTTPATGIGGSGVNNLNSLNTNNTSTTKVDPWAALTNPSNFSAATASFNTINNDTRKTGLSHNAVGVANMQGDPFAGLDSGSTNTNMGGSMNSIGGMNSMGGMSGMGSMNGMNNMQEGMGGMSGMGCMNGMNNMQGGMGGMSGMGSMNVGSMGVMSNMNSKNNDPFAGLM